MEHLSQQGMAIIWISSELPELLAMSDRIMVLADGRVQGTLSREEATQVRVMELRPTSVRHRQASRTLDENNH